ncbi:hypothetical protein [Pseudomonas saponiphila]|uniref:hypothetical protein n=1 Tax=Pseudomonas saponiphila TaxID=556534 RepID=UPI00224075B8|nr:hypothetical protein [Pseudomonas saponiphila]
MSGFFRRKAESWLIRLAAWILAGRNVHRSVDRIPETRKTGSWVEFDGESFPVKTGIRNFIVLTTERLKDVERRRKGKKEGAVV